MTHVILSKLSFVPIEKRRNAVQRQSNTAHKLTNKVYCACIKDSNEFKACVKLPNNTDFPDCLILDFTEESKKLIGKTDIFSCNPDKTGKYLHIIRTELDSSYYTNPELYTPFREEYVYSGYIVKIQNKMFFDVLDIIAHSSRCETLLNNIDSTESIFNK